MMDQRTKHDVEPPRTVGGAGGDVSASPELRMADLRRLLDTLHGLPDAVTACSAACALVAAELTDAGILIGRRASPSDRGGDIVLADYPSGIGMADIGGAETFTAPISRCDEGGVRGGTYLLAWRSCGDRRFGDDDKDLIRLIAPRFSGFVERMSSDAGDNCRHVVDAETGLWSLPKFVEQADRRFDRLDVEDRVGTMFAFGWVRCDGGSSAEASPAVVRASVSCLQEMLRPVDLLGRIGPTRLAAWCDGVDHLIAAERGDRIVNKLDALLTGTGRHAAIGIASRWPRSGDDPAAVLARARGGLEQARLKAASQGRPTVRIWQPPEH